MSSATLSNSSRVRQIAILISSVDAAAARQLLLHLPTELAKQVRGMVHKLGPVSAAEKRAILAEFQKSAGQGNNPRENSNATHAAPRDSTWDVPQTTASDYRVAADEIASQPDAANRTLSDSPLSQITSHAQARAQDQAVEKPHEHGTWAATSSQTTAEQDPAPAWTKLSTEALVRFVQGERTAVIAVVVSQLLPHKAVEVLRQLPRETHRTVLQRLSQLQDIDPAAMKSIDEHLAERLSDYQHRIESELENSRRLNALLSAAPAELQAEWKELLLDAAPATPDSAKATHPHAHQATLSSAAKQRSTQSTIAELYGDALLTTVDTVAQLPVQLAPTINPSLTSMVEDEVDILPFTRSQQTTSTSAQNAPAPTKHVDFDQILSLSPHHLAGLLSSLDSQTVLLALAGSTPEFMRSFSKLLNPRDAKALTRRLDSLGVINLRDVDEAQHRVVERAEKVLATVATAGTQRRQAA